MLKMSESIDLLASALATAQLDLKPASKDSNNPFFKSKYADLEAVIESSRQILAKNGLSVAQPVETTEDGVNWLTTILMHKSGQYIKSSVRLMMAKQDIQGFGSSITYTRRYAYCSITGVVAGDDDDGNAATSYKPSQKPATPTPDNSPKMSSDQYEILCKELESVPTHVVDAIRTKFHVDRMIDIKKADFMPLIDMLKNWKARNEKSRMDTREESHDVD